MISRILICFALVGLALQTSHAEEADPPHLQFWKALEGTWTFQESPGDLTGRVRWGLRTRGNTLMGLFTYSDGSFGRELAGWQADKQQLIVSGFGDANNYWQLEFPTVTATSVEGTARGVSPDGTEYEGKFVAKLEGENVLKYTMDGKTKAGEPLVRNGVFTKVVRDASVESNWRTPWTWLLGDWDVKRSDGSSARINWRRPRADTEMLYGTWQESDGTVLNETVGWHSDTGAMVAHAYGDKGSYFWVRFNEVSPTKMSGFYGNRNAAGETQRGTIEIELVSDDVAKSKLIGADGTTMTETFTRVKK